MAINKDCFEAGQRLSFDELVQYRAKKQKESKDAANKPAAKRPGRKKIMDDSGEQPTIEGAEKAQEAES